MTAPNQAESLLRRPVMSLWGVGAERARLLERLRIHTVEDLLLHKPRRYEDRRRFLAIRELQPGQPACVRGIVVASGVKRWKKGARAMFECVLEDSTARLHCRWWQAFPWMEEYFAVGREFVVFGKLESLRPRIVDHPETELVEAGEENLVHLNRIAPIYPLTEGLPQRWLRGLIWRSVDQLMTGGSFPEWNALDERLRFARTEAASLPGRSNAVTMLHFPEEFEDIEIARRRLALDEFVDLQVHMQQRRKLFESRSKALPCGGDNNRLMKPFLQVLGFKLTASQANVLREIRHDLRGEHPMRRLLQGDVGSGKTAVAACSALMALECGFNVALMAPTEILAEQHHRNFSRWFESLGVRVELRTGSTRAALAHGSRSLEEVKPLLVIGTHALVSSGFEIQKLGLVIIDEQHKFGVAQREQLVRKGHYPHLLVMTATPIPRTLGLTLYGDLDVSTIDAAPPGRGKIKTFVRTTDTLPKVWSFIREKLAAGRQAYVVYPRVEENQGNEVKAVMKEFEVLKRQLAPYSVAMLHGRMKAAEKEGVMAEFRANRVHVLLATSLIEVGVDVPNATVMLIENAEQFGLAQLHQLRGRIGRGVHDSHCILVSAAGNIEARERLQVLEATRDGFQIAEADLKLRGPGELLGKDQSGVPAFRFGNLAQDLELISFAREIARGR
ncbi:MAG TPA: ATP-dependent DNA helicase RecG [Verrucomicrobiae bacterium]|nr:ATP-dependent DNA helicase RecG [Verrucomicrobiae bacterium]